MIGDGESMASPLSHRAPVWLPALQFESRPHLVGHKKGAGVNEALQENNAPPSFQLLNTDTDINLNTWSDYLQTFILIEQTDL